MRIKNIILSGLLTLGVLSASAQEQQNGTTVYDFKPHWYLQLQPLGGQYTLGEVDFSDLVSYNVQAALGYNFTKVVGLRLAVNGWQSKAGIEIDDFKETWKWNYIAPSIDLTFNLTNLICDFNPNRVFNLSAFIGGGINYAYDNGGARKADKKLGEFLENTPGRAQYSYQNLRYLWSGSKIRGFGQAGLIADIRLSNAVSLNLEASANVLNDRYNSKRSANADWYFNALAGLKVNLGKTSTSRFVPAPEPEIRYVEKIVEKVVEVPAKVEEAPVIEPIRRDVFFKINSYQIRKAEEQKVKDIADYMQKYPNSKVVVTGYADAGTGNDRINDRLAAQRADAVVKALKTQYNISADRITYDSKGARVQPFAENDKNRVTICIAE